MVTGLTVEAGLTCLEADWHTGWSHCSLSGSSPGPHLTDPRLPGPCARWLWLVASVSCVVAGPGHQPRHLRPSIPQPRPGPAERSARALAQVTALSSPGSHWWHSDTELTPVYGDNWPRGPHIRTLAMQAPEMISVVAITVATLKLMAPIIPGHISDVSVHVCVVSSEIQTAKMISSTQLNWCTPTTET